MKRYIDNKNRVIAVKEGLGNVYKPYYQDLNDLGSSWRYKSLRQFKWRDTKEEAQKDLDYYATKKKWKEFSNG